MVIYINLETITLSGAIIAVVEFIKNIDSSNRVSGWVTPIVAIVLGGLAGYFHVFGTPDLTTGIMSGLLASGVHTAASAMGGK